MPGGNDRSTVEAMRKTFATLAVLALLGACSSSDDEAETTTGQAQPTSSETGSSTASDIEEPSQTGEPAQTEEPDETGEPDQTSEPHETDEPAEADPAANALPDFVTGESQSPGFPNLEGEYLAVETRLGSHDGYDRVVVEYTGTGTLNWHAHYTDTPVEEGSGFEVDIPGNMFLQVSVSGISYPDPSSPEVPHTGQDSTSVVSVVEYGGPFEGMHELYIGLDKERDYRVFVDEDPSRLVIDIATDE